MTTHALLSLRFTRTDPEGNIETLSLVRLLSTGALAVQLRADSPPHDPDDTGTIFGFTGHQLPQHIGAGCVARHDQADASLFEPVPRDRLFGHEAETIARAIALPGEDVRAYLGCCERGCPDKNCLPFARIFAGWASPTLTLAPWPADVAALAEAATEAAQDRFDAKLDAELPGWIEASGRAAIEGDETDVIEPATSCPVCPIVCSAGHGYAWTETLACWLAGQPITCPACKGTKASGNFPCSSCLSAGTITRAALPLDDLGRFYVTQTMILSGAFGIPVERYPERRTHVSDALALLGWVAGKRIELPRVPGASRVFVTPYYAPAPTDLEPVDLEARAAEATEQAELVRVLTEEHAGIEPVVPCPACPIVRSAGHGYASDLDALRAVVTLYSEAAIDALATYYATDAAGPGLSVTLDRWSDLSQAAKRLGEAWAVCRARPMVDADAALDRVENWDFGEKRAGPWFLVVVADVRARLSGEMSRPLPASPAPEQVVAEAEKPEVWIGGEFLQREPPEPLPMADEAPVSPAPTTRPSIRPGEPEAAARASLPPPADDEPIGLGILGELR